MKSFRVANRIQNFSKSRKSYSTVVGFSETDANNHSEILSYVRPYNEVPGPKGLPIIGNSWRFLPLIGHYQLPALDKVMESLYRDYGEIVKISGLIGHPDLLFVFNPNEIERIFKREETMPHRPSMPSVKYYKQVLHKDFFGKNTGVVGVDYLGGYGSRPNSVLVPIIAYKRSRTSHLYRYESGYQRPFIHCVV